MDQGFYGWNSLTTPWKVFEILGMKGSLHLFKQSFPEVTDLAVAPVPMDVACALHCQSMLCQERASPHTTTSRKPLQTRRAPAASWLPLPKGLKFAWITSFGQSYLIMMNLLEGLLSPGLCPYRRKSGVYTEFIVIWALQNEQLAIRTPGIGTFQKGLGAMCQEKVDWSWTFSHTDIWEGTQNTDTLQGHAAACRPCPSCAGGEQ